MPFSYRVFCRDTATTNLSDILMWMRQHDIAATISGGVGTVDLLSSFWTEAELVLSDTETLSLRCFRADAAGMQRVTEERDDFVADVQELRDSPMRTRVLDLLASARSLLVIEFPSGTVSTDSAFAAELVTDLFAERADGMAQHDGAGFVDDDGEVILGLA
jgi:hypothetical protein